MDRDCDVIVIGAGLSGLTAAYQLKKTQPELKVMVLEARSRVGGRTYTIEMNVAGGHKKMFDVGGQWVGPIQTDLIDLMKELGMHNLLYPQWVTGTKVCWVEPGHIIKYNTELPFYNPVIYIEAYAFMKKCDYYADQLDTNNPYLRNPALADYLDAMTAESFVRQNVHNPVLRELFRIGIRTTFGFETSQISALYVVLYGKASGRMENLFSSTKDGAQTMRVDGGMAQVSQRLAEIVGEKNIIMNAPVKAIDQTADSVTVTVSFNEGGSLARFVARRVIMAIPPPHQAQIKMNPPWPSSRMEVLRALPMSNLSKFAITYPRAFWRDKGLSGEVVCYGGDPEKPGSELCPVGPVSVTYDGTLPDGTPALIGFTAGHQTVYWGERSSEEKKRAILWTLSKMIGEEALQPIDFHEKNWAFEEWTGGCPVACLQPGVGRFFTSSMRLPFQHVHMAGTESAQRSIGYMSGAVQAGRRAAVEVLHSLSKQSPADPAILAATSFGPAGRALRWSIKWPTVNDPCMVSLDSTNWGYKAAIGVAFAFILYRQFFDGKKFSFNIEKFTKLWSWS